LSQFTTYLVLGFQHISDLSAYDHILFIVALCAIYRISEWKNIAIMVTAFTLGHSLTLALATLEVLLVPTEIIEFLIPVTILLTCIYNVSLSKQKHTEQTTVRLNYFLALFFGLIHGMGFSNYLRMLLGREEGILTPLFAFNVGLEAGQLLIVACVLGVLFIAERIFKVKHRDWTVFVSGAAAGISLILISETKFW
jgi:ABC-type antimicrobial peptide transport system permease subunit